MTAQHKVILPIIRRVMPDIIANDIIGAQPMSGPTGSIVSLRASMFPGVLETFDGHIYIPYNIRIMWWFKNQQHKGKEKCQRLKKKCQRSISATLSGMTI